MSQLSCQTPNLDWDPARNWNRTRGWASPEPLTLTTVSGDIVCRIPEIIRRRPTSSSDSSTSELWHARKAEVNIGTLWFVGISTALAWTICYKVICLIFNECRNSCTEMWTTQTRRRLLHHGDVPWRDSHLKKGRWPNGPIPSILLSVLLLKPTKWGTRYRGTPEK